jgi:hypothetical protein
MTEMMSDVDDAEDPTPAEGVDGLDEQLISQFVDRARAGGLQLTGEGGGLQQLTKRLLESALDHLGYDKHDPAGHNTGNSRNGTRAKTVLTEVGPVELEAPRDRDSSFEPRIVAKRQKHLTGVDEMVISLAAKGLTPGEIAAHLPGRRTKARLDLCGEDEDAASGEVDCHHHADVAGCGTSYVSSDVRRISWARAYAVGTSSSSATNTRPMTRTALCGDNTCPMPSGTVPLQRRPLIRWYPEAVPVVRVPTYAKFVFVAESVNCTL